MHHVILYRKNHCGLCDEAESMLEILQSSYPFEIEHRDIDKNDEWLLKYLIQIPVVEMNGESLAANEIDFDSLDRLLKKYLSK